jgi:hypothetical protein
MGIALDYWDVNKGFPLPKIEKNEVAAQDAGDRAMIWLIGRLDQRK